MKMNKKKTKKEDCRKLIYYSFEEEKLNTDNNKCEKEKK